MMICNCLLDVLIFPNSFEKTGACNLPVLLTLSILQKKNDDYVPCTYKMNDKKYFVLKKWKLISFLYRV